MASRYLDCIKKVVNATENKITDSEAEKLMDDVADFIKTKKAQGKVSDMDAEVMKYINDSATADEFAAAVKARTRILNQIAKFKVKEHLANFNDKNLGIQALLGGAMRFFKGARKSIDAQQKFLGDFYQKKLMRLLEEHDVWEAFIRGKIERQIMEELFELKPGGAPGKSGNKNAREIAKIIHQIQASAVDDANLAGAWISKLPGYIMRQTHNMLKIRRAGFESWYEFIKPRLDLDKTAGHIPVAEQKEFFRSIWHALKTGVHLKYQDGFNEFDPITHLGMPGNMAKRISQHRLLHFKDGKSFMEYNTHFGHNSLQENIMSGLDHMAKSTVLMKNLGTNPEAMLRTIIKEEVAALKKLQKKLPSKEADKLDKQIEKLNRSLKSKQTFLWNIFSEIDGTARIPDNVKMANVVGGWMAIQNMAKLGGATISSFTDIANKAAELRFQGFGFFNRWGKVFADLGKGRGAPKSERRLVSQMVGVGLDGHIGNMINRWSTIDQMPGMLAKSSQKFFKWNLMNWWNDSHRAGMAQVMSFNLAQQRKLPFKKLDADTQRILKTFDIDELEWDVIRQAVWTHGATKRSYITAEAMLDLSDDIILGYVKKKEGVPSMKVSQSRIKRTRQDLQLSIGSYFVDRADFAIPMPGAWERAFQHLGTQPGTYLGSALRLLWQFKSFPLTVTRRAVGRELYGKGKADLYGLAQFIASTTVLGYVSMATKDILKGRIPRVFNDDYTHNTKVLLAAMTQGGGLGIYGDFLFGEYNRFGGGWLKTAAGPTIGQLGDVAAIFSQAIRGESEATNLAAQLGKIITSNTPFINLFYTKMIMDYLILYNIQEMANPGYVKRMEKRLNKKNNQRFYLSPSRVIPRGGTDPFSAGGNLVEEIGNL
tara:strand:+ start:33011 stop:35650 length:2640 start_codon:yes stop_codon:yes gene_type:complete